MKLSRLLRALAASVVMLTVVVIPAIGQEAPRVLILPIDKAEFLPGALFDFRVEVHADTLPENFAVTVNGTPAAEFFSAEAISESWQFGRSSSTANSLIWRRVTAPAPGEYIVEVMAGGTAASVTWTVRQPSVGMGAKNVILFIADGMTVSMITAARIASRGITQGTLHDTFYMDTLDEIGLAHTSSINSLIADSASTASALNTGHIASVGATGSYSDTSPDRLDDPAVETLAEMIKRTRGMAVGVVTTADFSDATPAAVWAHGRDRSNANRNTYLVQALENGSVDVLMGGGARRMIPQIVEKSSRDDDRDLFAEYAAVGFTIVTSQDELDSALVENPPKLVGAFHPNDMNAWLDRNVYVDNLDDVTSQPGLVDMTLAALDILSQNPNGFYLEVEAAGIDKYFHPLDQERALSDLIEFDFAVGAAIEWAMQNAPDTLIVVTADHGHGYDVFGSVNVAEFNIASDAVGRRNAVSVSSDADYPTYSDADGDGFPDWEADIVFAAGVNNGPDHTENFQVSRVPRVPTIELPNGIYEDNPHDDPNGIFQLGNLPLDKGTGAHTLQDVPVFAGGPGADAFGGVYHQKEIFFAMAAAIGLDPSQPDGMAE